MDAKEQLINNIKEWLKYDTEINKLKLTIKELNDKKKILTEDLVTVMKNNSIDCFDINNGALTYKQTKVKKPLNSKTLLVTLQKYYKDNPNVADELTKYIMNNREEKIKDIISIKRS
jgi:hypothetical protein